MRTCKKRRIVWQKRNGIICDPFVPFTPRILKYLMRLRLFLPVMYWKKNYGQKQPLSKYILLTFHGKTFHGKKQSYILSDCLVMYIPDGWIQPGRNSGN